MRLDEPERLNTLRATRLLDNPPDGDFDRLTRLAARLLRAPASLVTLVDEHRQFLASTCGPLPESVARTRETPLSHSFCKHVVMEEAALVVDDARTHPVVRDNPAVREFGVIAYLGMPLQTSSGMTLGSFCVVDGQPRQWTDNDLSLLREIADLVVDRIELRLLAGTLEKQYLDLRSLEIRRDELVHMIVHDLRNPMSSYLMALALIERSTDMPPQHAEALQIAHRGGERLLTLVENILDVSKSEAGELSLNRSTFDAIRLVQDAGVEVSPLADARNVRLELHWNTPRVELNADREKLMRILVNLLANAIQHTKKNGSVDVAVAAAWSGQIDFSIRDQGRGIPREALARLFDKYGQTGTKAHGASTGLGLTFAKMVVEAHGGRIEAESTPDSGTLFRLSLPAPTARATLHRTVEAR